MHLGYIKNIHNMMLILLSDMLIMLSIMLIMPSIMFIMPSIMLIMLSTMLGIILKLSFLGSCRPCASQGRCD